MDVLGSVRMSWRNIRDHSLRSTLTTLGVIIGVAAVITFVTLGASLQAEIISTVAGENTDVMYVSVTPEGDSRFPSVGRGGQAVFTDHDVGTLRGVLGVSAAVPIGGFATAQVRYRNDSVSRQWITVTSPGYFEARNHTFVAGSPFRPGDREVVLNERAASMFAENVSVGDRLRLVRSAGAASENATVVGIVRESREEGSLLTGPTQPAFYAPADPFYDRTVVSPTTGAEQRVYSQVLVVVDDPREVEVVQGRVYTQLARNTDASVLKPDGYAFEVTTHEQLVDRIREVSTTFTAYIAGVALISLVVGSIGIANIMLVSVTERTREIGIMKAIGARRRDVLQLFLVEAVLLGVIGSLMGLGVGYAGGYAATRFVGLPLRFRGELAVLSVGVGIAVGVVSGLYPAWRAARTDPITALRHE